MWTNYDDLGRVKDSSQDSELGLLTTTMTYGVPFTTTATNPRGKSTTTAFWAYDQPATDWPRTISAPEGVTTEIDRDPFGKPKSIQRSGPYAGATLSASKTGSRPELSTSTECRAPVSPRITEVLGSFIGTSESLLPAAGAC